MTDAKQTTKTVVGLVAQYGTALIISGAALAVAPTAKIHQKISVGVASIAIGGLLGEHVRKYTDDLIDIFWELPAEIKKLKSA